MNIFSWDPPPGFSLCVSLLIRNILFMRSERLWSCGIVINLFFSGWTLKALETFCDFSGHNVAKITTYFPTRKMQNINKWNQTQTDGFPSGAQWSGFQEFWIWTLTSHPSHPELALVQPQGVPGGLCLSVPSSQMLPALPHLGQKFQN